MFSNKRGEYSYKDGAWIGPDGEKVSPAGERILTSIAEERIYSSAPLRNAVARYKEIAVEDLTWGERDTSDYRQEIAKLEEEGKAGSDRHEELKDKLSRALNQMESWKQELNWLVVFLTVRTGLIRRSDSGVVAPFQVRSGLAGRPESNLRGFTATDTGEDRACVFHRIVCILQTHFISHRDRDVFVKLEIQIRTYRILIEAIT